LIDDDRATGMAWPSAVQKSTDIHQLHQGHTPPGTLAMVTQPVYFTLPVGYRVNMLRIDPRWVSATKGTTFGAGLFVRVIVF
jgi:hypothetical protein